MLKAFNIYKTYKNGYEPLQVLKGVDLSIEDGKIVSILGPSGAGKSTLLNIIGGLDFPTQGNVFLKDVDLFKVSDKKRTYLRNKHIGFVFQFYHLLPEFTALENTVLPALVSKELNKKQAFKRAEKVLDEVGLSERLYHKPNALSGGEQQRVAIARALVNNPDILLCDEPTGNLDSETADKVLSILWDLNKDRTKTFIIVTHDKSIAEKSDQVVHLKDGLIQM